MTGGHIHVKGDVGMHIGSQMSGGEIIVEGSASDWAGAEMKGGLLQIKGDAGDLLGAAYRGSSDGMTGGCILVEGRAGVETGSFMRRGMIVVLGDLGPFTGVHMNGGEIFVFGRAARRIGAEMKGNGGIIVCFGEVEDLLPTFVYDTSYQPTFMKLYLKELREELGVQDAEKFLDTSFRRYRGDAAVGGNGEILVAERQGA
jgi:formylmethanofuran dehydrogenase subunit C